MTKSREIPDDLRNQIISLSKGEFGARYIARLLHLPFHCFLYCEKWERHAIQKILKERDVLKR